MKGFSFFIFHPVLLPLLVQRHTPRKGLHWSSRQIKANFPEPHGVLCAWNGVPKPPITSLMTIVLLGICSVLAHLNKDGRPLHAAPYLSKLIEKIPN